MEHPVHREQLDVVACCSSDRHPPRKTPAPTSSQTRAIHPGLPESTDVPESADVSADDAAPTAGTHPAPRPRRGCPGCPACPGSSGCPGCPGSPACPGSSPGYQRRGVIGGGCVNFQGQPVSCSNPVGP